MPHAARAALQKPAASIPPASLSAAAAILDQCYLYVYSGFFLLRPPSVASSNLRKKKILNTYLAGHANINNSRFLKYRSAEKFAKLILCLAWHAARVFAKAIIMKEPWRLFS